MVGDAGWLLSAEADETTGGISQLTYVVSEVQTGDAHSEVPDRLLRPVEANPPNHGHNSSGYGRTSKGMRELMPDGYALAGYLQGDTCQGDDGRD